MKAAIRGMDVADYVLFLIDADERKSEQNAEADEAHKSTDNQSSKINEQ